MVAATDSARLSVAKLGPASTAAGNASSRAFQASGQAAVNLSAEIDRVKSAALRLAGTLGAAGGAVQFARSVIDASNAMIGFRSALTAATGSAEASASAIAFVRAESDRLGLSFRNSVGGFAQLSAATRGTALEGQKTRDVFSAVSEAARVLNLSAETTSSALNALQQMVSKGTVASEELRGQLGERLPGAFNLAAQAMGVTTAQLSKMLEAGQITADELLPKLAQRLHEVFGSQAVQAAGSPAAEFERLRNSLFDLQVAVGDAGFMAQLASGARSLAGALTRLTEGGALDKLASGLVLVGEVALAAFSGRVLAGIGNFAARQRDAVIATAINIEVSRDLARSVLATAAAKTTELTATLRVIEAARAESVAKQAQVVAEVRAAETALAAASATTQESFALKVQREATDQLVRSKASLVAISTDLAVLGRGQTQVQGQLAAATAAQQLAQQQSNAALAAGGIVMAGLRTAGGRLLGFLGGWPGVVLLAAGALYKLWDAARAGEAAANAPLAALGELNDKLERQLKLKALVDSGRATANNVESVDVLSGSVARAVQLQQALAEARRSLEALTSVPAGKGAQGAIIAQHRAVEQLAADFSAARAEVSRYASNLQSAAELTPSIRAMVIEVDGLGQTFQATSGPISRFNANAELARNAAKQFAASNEELTQSLQQTVDKLALEKVELVSGLRARLIAEAAKKAGVAGYAQLNSAVQEQIDTIARESASVDALKKARAAATKTSTDAARAETQFTGALRDMANGADAAAATLAGPLAKAEADHIDALRKIASEGAAAITSSKKLADADAKQVAVQSAVTAAIDVESSAYDRNVKLITAEIAARNAQLSPLESVVRGYQNEIELLNTSADARAELNDQREVESETLKVVAEMQQANTEALKNGTAITDIDTEAIRKRIAALREQLTLSQAQEALRTQGGSFGFLGGQPNANGDQTKVFSGNTFGEHLANSVQNAFDVGNLGGFFSGFGKAFKKQTGEAGKDYADRLGKNINGALGMVGNAIQSIKKEGIVSGLLSVAESIPGPVGMIAGAIKSVLAIFSSLFGKKPKLKLSGSDFSGSEANTTTAFGAIFLDNDKTNISTQKILDSIRAFDQAIADSVTSFDGSAERMAAISAKLRGFTSTLKGDDATPEKLLEERFDAILSTFSATMQTFVKGAAGMESQVHRLHEIMAAEAAFVAAKLDVPIDALLTMAIDLKKGGESIAQTATRIIGSVVSLNALADLTGTVFDAVGEDFVRLAGTLSGVVGGLDKLQALFKTFQETFFTPAEIAQTQGQTAANDRATQLTGLGLDTNISNDAFRAAFEAALPTATAEQIAQWLRAGSAIAAAAAAQTALNAVYDAAIAVQQKHVDALQAYANGIADIGDELLRTHLTDFGAEIRDINQWSDDARSELNRLAVAAGLSAASEESLAAVHELAAFKAGEAMKKLRQHASDLVQQLQGSQLDQLNAQIDAINAASEAQVNGINDVATAAADAAQAQMDAQMRIREFVDGILRDPARGGLRPRDALPIAQAQLQAVFAAAQGGDAAALAQFPQLADEILRLAQQVFPAGSDPFIAIRDGIIAQGDQLAGQPVAPGGGVGGGNVGGAGAGAPGGDLATLTAQRDQLVADQLAATRLALAQELSAAIRDLVIATGDPLAEIATQLGLNVTDLVTALGVNLTDLTSTTASQLAQVAQDMGVNLSELSAQVGVDLGSLADAQSLLNDALEAQISTLPDAQRDALQPLLADVEAAAALGDNTALFAAQGALETAVNGLSPSLKDKLAPFFDAIDPTNFTQLDALSFIDSNTADLLARAKDQLAELVAQTHLLDGIAAATPPLAETEHDRDDIATGARQDPDRGHGPVYEAMRRNMAASNEGNHFVSYSVGTGYVPRTGLALLHRGEAVLPDPVAAFFRREGIPVARAAGSDPELLAEMRAAREALQAANKKHDETARRLDSLEKTTSSGSRELVAATDRQTNTMRSLR